LANVLFPQEDHPSIVIIIFRFAVTGAKMPTINQSAKKGSYLISGINFVNGQWSIVNRESSIVNWWSFAVRSLFWMVNGAAPTGALKKVGMENVERRSMRNANLRVIHASQFV
jgi:hypothetical protein